LLVSTALSAAIGCGGKKATPDVMYSNPKGTMYDKSLADAGVDAAPDANEQVKPPERDDEIYANPKGAFYDDGLAKSPAK
jgi:hypothetical protein